MRVCQARGDFDLAEETIVAEGGGQLGPQHLDRYLPAVAQVLGQVDCRHASGAELALDAVAVGESGRQALRARFHRLVMALLRSMEANSERSPTHRTGIRGIFMGPDGHIHITTSSRMPAARRPDDLLLRIRLP